MARSSTHDDSATLELTSTTAAEPLSPPPTEAVQAPASKKATCSACGLCSSALLLLGSGCAGGICGASMGLIGMYLAFWFRVLGEMHVLALSGLMAGVSAISCLMGFIGGMACSIRLKIHQ